MAKLIKRINELAALKKLRPLTPQETKEQKELYGVYLAAIRGQLKAQLDAIELVDEEGNVTPLRKRDSLLN